MRVLLTGGSGNLGQALVPRLLETAAAIDADLAAAGVVSYDLTRQWLGGDE